MARTKDIMLSPGDSSRKFGRGKASGLVGEGQYDGVLLCSPPSARVARGGEGSGVGGGSADSLSASCAERPPTPDPSPPLRGRRGESNYADAVVTPPSTTMVWPVMKVEAPEAR